MFNRAFIKKVAGIDIPENDAFYTFSSDVEAEQMKKAVPFTDPKTWKRSLVALAKKQPRGSVAILGAGRGYDIPLLELALAFSQVTVVDLDDSVAKDVLGDLQKSLRDLALPEGEVRAIMGRVRFQAADLSGVAAEFSQRVEKIRAQGKSEQDRTDLYVALLKDMTAKIPETLPIQGQYSLVISSLLTSAMATALNVSALDSLDLQGVDDTDFLEAKYAFYDTLGAYHLDHMKKLLATDGKIYWSDTVETVPVILNPATGRESYVMNQKQLSFPIQAFFKKVEKDFQFNLMGPWGWTSHPPDSLVPEGRGFMVYAFEIQPPKATVQKPAPAEVAWKAGDRVREIRSGKAFTIETVDAQAQKVHFREDRPGTTVSISFLEYKYTRIDEGAADGQVQQMEPGVRSEVREIELTERLGLPAVLNPETLEIKYGTGVGFLNAWKKTLLSETPKGNGLPLWKSLKFAADYVDAQGVLIRQPDLARFYDPEKTLYLGHQGAYWTDAGLWAQLKKHKLRPDVTALPAGFVGDEYLRTEGHDHLSGFPEVYETVYGENSFLLFKAVPKFFLKNAAVKAVKKALKALNSLLVFLCKLFSWKKLTPIHFAWLDNYSEDTEDIEDAMFVFSEAGDHVLFPPGYQHISVNTGTTPFVMTDWVSTKADSDFKYIKRHNGAPYWIVKGPDGKPLPVRNPGYKGKVPEIRLVRPAAEIKLDGQVIFKKGVPMFNLVEEGKIDLLRFLNNTNFFGRYNTLYQQAFVPARSEVRGMTSATDNVRRATKEKTLSVDRSALTAAAGRTVRVGLLGLSLAALVGFGNGCATQSPIASSFGQTHSESVQQPTFKNLVDQVITVDQVIIHDNRAWARDRIGRPYFLFGIGSWTPFTFPGKGIEIPDGAKYLRFELDPEVPTSVEKVFRPPYIEVYKNDITSGNKETAITVGLFGNVIAMDGYYKLYGWDWVVQPADAEHRICTIDVPLKKGAQWIKTVVFSTHGGGDRPSFSLHEIRFVTGAEHRRVGQFTNDKDLPRRSQFGNFQNPAYLMQGDSRSEMRVVTKEPALLPNANTARYIAENRQFKKLQVAADNRPEVQALKVRRQAALKMAYETDIRPTDERQAQRLVASVNGLLDELRRLDLELAKLVVEGKATVEVNSPLPRSTDRSEVRDVSADSNRRTANGETAPIVRRPVTEVLAILTALEAHSIYSQEAEVGGAEARLFGLPRTILVLWKDGRAQLAFDRQPDGSPNVFNIAAGEIFDVRTKDEDGKKVVFILVPDSIAAGIEHLGYKEIISEVVPIKLVFVGASSANSLEPRKDLAVQIAQEMLSKDPFIEWLDVLSIFINMDQGRHTDTVKKVLSEFGISLDAASLANNPEHKKLIGEVAEALKMLKRAEVRSELRQRSEASQDAIDDLAKRVHKEHQWLALRNTVGEEGFKKFLKLTGRKEIPEMSKIVMAILVLGELVPTKQSLSETSPEVARKEEERLRALGHEGIMEEHSARVRNGIRILLTEHWAEELDSTRQNLELQGVTSEMVRRFMKEESIDNQAKAALQGVTTRWGVPRLEDIPVSSWAQFALQSLMESYQTEKRAELRSMDRIVRVGLAGLSLAGLLGLSNGCMSFRSSGFPDFSNTLLVQQSAASNLLSSNPPIVKLQPDEWEAVDLDSESIDIPESAKYLKLILKPLTPPSFLNTYIAPFIEAYGDSHQPVIEDPDYPPTGRRPYYKLFGGDFGKQVGDVFVITIPVRPGATKLEKLIFSTHGSVQYVSPVEVQYVGFTDAGGNAVPASARQELRAPRSEARQREDMTGPSAVAPSGSIIRAEVRTESKTGTYGKKHKRHDELGPNAAVALLRLQAGNNATVGELTKKVLASGGSTAVAGGIGIPDSLIRSKPTQRSEVRAADLSALEQLLTEAGHVALREKDPLLKKIAEELIRILPSQERSVSELRPIGAKLAGLSIEESRRLFWWFAKLAGGLRNPYLFQNGIVAAIISDIYRSQPSAKDLTAEALQKMVDREMQRYEEIAIRNTFKKTASGTEGTGSKQSRSEARKLVTVTKSDSHHVSGISTRSEVRSSSSGRVPGDAAGAEKYGRVRAATGRLYHELNMLPIHQADQELLESKAQTFLKTTSHIVFFEEAPSFIAHIFDLSTGRLIARREFSSRDGSILTNSQFFSASAREVPSSRGFVSIVPGHGIVARSPEPRTEYVIETTDLGTGKADEQTFRTEKEWLDRWNEIGRTAANQRRSEVRENTFSVTGDGKTSLAELIRNAIIGKKADLDDLDWIKRGGTVIPLKHPRLTFATELSVIIPENGEKVEAHWSSLSQDENQEMVEETVEDWVPTGEIVEEEVVYSDGLIEIKRRPVMEKRWVTRWVSKPRQWEAMQRDAENQDRSEVRGLTAGGTANGERETMRSALPEMTLPAAKGRRSEARTVEQDQMPAFVSRTDTRLEREGTATRTTSSTRISRFSTEDNLSSTAVNRSGIGATTSVTARKSARRLSTRTPTSVFEKALSFFLPRVINNQTPTLVSRLVSRTLIDGMATRMASLTSFMSILSSWTSVFSTPTSPLTETKSSAITAMSLRSDSTSVPTSVLEKALSFFLPRVINNQTPTLASMAETRRVNDGIAMRTPSSIVMSLTLTSAMSVLRRLTSFLTELRSSAMTEISLRTDSTRVPTSVTEYVFSFFFPSIMLKTSHAVRSLAGKASLVNINNQQFYNPFSAISILTVSTAAHSEVRGILGDRGQGIEDRQILNPNAYTLNPNEGRSEVREADGQVTPRESDGSYTRFGEASARRTGMQGRVRIPEKIWSLEEKPDENEMRRRVVEFYKKTFRSEPWALAALSDYLRHVIPLAIAVEAAFLKQRDLKLSRAEIALEMAIAKIAFQRRFQWLETFFFFTQLVRKVVAQVSGDKNSWVIPLDPSELEALSQVGIAKTEAEAMILETIEIFRGSVRLNGESKKTVADFVSSKGKPNDLLTSTFSEMFQGKIPLTVKSETKSPSVLSRAELRSYIPESLRKVLLSSSYDSGVEGDAGDGTRVHISGLFAPHIEASIKELAGREHITTLYDLVAFILENPDAAVKQFGLMKHGRLNIRDSSFLFNGILMSIDDQGITDAVARLFILSPEIRKIFPLRTVAVTVYDYTGESAMAPSQGDDTFERLPTVASFMEHLGQAPSIEKGFESITDKYVRAQLKTVLKRLGIDLPLPQDPKSRSFARGESVHRQIRLADESASGGEVRGNKPLGASAPNLAAYLLVKGPEERKALSPVLVQLRSDVEGYAREFLKKEKDFENLTVTITPVGKQNLIDMEVAFKAARYRHVADELLKDLIARFPSLSSESFVQDAGYYYWLRLIPARSEVRDQNSATVNAQRSTLDEKDSALRVAPDTLSAAEGRGRSEVRNLSAIDLFAMPHGKDQNAGLLPVEDHAVVTDAEAVAGRAGALNLGVFGQFKKHPLGMPREVVTDHFVLGIPALYLTSLLLTRPDTLDSLRAFRKAGLTASAFSPISARVSGPNTTAIVAPLALIILMMPLTGNGSLALVAVVLTSMIFSSERLLSNGVMITPLFSLPRIIARPDSFVQPRRSEARSAVRLTSEKKGFTIELGNRWHRERVTNYYYGDDGTYSEKSFLLEFPLTVTITMPQGRFRVPIFNSPSGGYWRDTIQRLFVELPGTEGVFIASISGVTSREAWNPDGYLGKALQKVIKNYLSGNELKNGSALLKGEKVLFTSGLSGAVLWSIPDGIKFKIHFLNSKGQISYSATATLQITSSKTNIKIEGAKSWRGYEKKGSTSIFTDDREMLRLTPMEGGHLSVLAIGNPFERRVSLERMDLSLPAGRQAPILKAAAKTKISQRVQDLANDKTVRSEVRLPAGSLSATLRMDSSSGEEGTRQSSVAGVREIAPLKEDLTLQVKGNAKEWVDQFGLVTRIPVDMSKRKSKSAMKTLLELSDLTDQVARSAQYHVVYHMVTTEGGIYAGVEIANPDGKIFIIDLRQHPGGALISEFPEAYIEALRAKLIKNAVMVSNGFRAVSVDRTYEKSNGQTVIIKAKQARAEVRGILSSTGHGPRITEKTERGAWIVERGTKKEVRSETRMEATVANDWLLAVSYEKPRVESSPLETGTRGILATAKQVTGNIFAVSVTKLKSFASVIAQAFFPEHFSAEAEIMRGMNVAAARQILPIKVTESGHAIVVTPGVVEMGLLPVLRAVFQSSDIFVVGADNVQERLAREMEQKISGLKLDTVVEFVKDLPAFQAAVAKRTAKRGVSRMQFSGLSTANDPLELATALKTQIPDFMSVTHSIFQKFQPYTNEFIQGLVAEFQAAISRERSA
ncbi:MAG: hypothetical protein A2351_04235 [Omnitrophica bacterium RIFOXYB12_FULL_50_7]|nr:MAG: hypothetical protein A2351_04235 [Omnitrophica bacterium RIFOXYB12_FULL_50_7]